MKAVDTNVLVYAHREEMPLHAAAHRRLTELAQSAVPWGIPVFCVGEFVRVVTHRRIFCPPSSLETALGFIDAVSKSPSLMLLGPDGDYWTTFRDLALSAKASGNLAFDAQIAAVCASHGATLITADRDFSRFAVELEVFST